MIEQKQETPSAEPAQALGAADKIWKLNGRFPVVVDYLVFLGIFLAAQAIGALTAWLVGCRVPAFEQLSSADEAVQLAAQISISHFNAVSYFVAMALTLGGFLFYRYQRRGPRVVARFSARGLNPVMLLWGIAFILAASVVLEPLLNLLPDVPNAYGRGAWALVTLVVMAPLFEETIFRGVLLESTRVRYGVIVAWVVSSLLFGIVHLHPTIVVNAFVVGLILGFIYIVSDSLWATIILHAVNNGIAYLALVTGHGNTMLIDLVENRTVYVVVYIAALAVFVVSGYMTFRKLKRLKAEEKNRAAA